MKKLFLLLLVTISIVSCESSKQDKVLDFFDGIGVRIDMEKSNQCLYEQLDEIYKTAVIPTNTEKIVSVIREKDLRKIVLKVKEEIPVQCDQAILDKYNPVSKKTCDPGTYVGAKANLKSTTITYNQGTLTLVVNSQESVRNLILYDFPELSDEEIFNFEKEVTRKNGDKEYLSFDEITESFKTFESNIKLRSTVPDGVSCGKNLTLLQILSLIYMSETL